MSGALDAVATFDHIGLEADRTRGTVKLQKETTSITKYRSDLISPPKRRSGGRAILAYRLLIAGAKVSMCSHLEGIKAIRIGRSKGCGR